MSSLATGIKAPGLVLADALTPTRTRMRDAGLVLGGALLTALCAQIEVPIPGTPVPLSLQTLAVVIVGASLGATRGASALALYAALGLLLPFYSGGASGPDVVFGATGGYIIGFIAAAWFVGYAAELGADRRPLIAFGIFAVGQAAVFIVGVPWLMVVTGLDLAAGLSQGFFPFIVGGIVKALIAAGVMTAGWQLVRRTGRK